MNRSAEPVWGNEMKQLLASVVVGVFLLTAVVVDAAVAHTYVAETSLSIHKEPRGITQAGTKVFIFGRLKSARPACRFNEWVKLMKAVPGPDKAIARDKTDGEGNYRFVLQPLRDQTVYARFLGSFNSSVGHSHRCLSSRSRIRWINVS
jgi:hypothetical protein